VTTGPGSSRQQHPPREQDEYTDDISLRPYLDTLWRYRAVIGAITLAVGAIFLVGALALIVLAPVERIASMEFRLLFSGANRNQYPNEAPFSPAEIVAPPVIAEVFRNNELERFGKYEDFKSALFIQQSNPALEMLAAEYNARLADPKLTTVDRTRIETEFRTRRESLVDPSFAISLRRGERFRTIPEELVQKVLSDTLATWARQADQIKGVTRYQLPVISGEILTKEEIEGSDYLIAADRLRARTAHLLDIIEQMAEIPGALTIRISEGRVSLAELQARLQNLLRFDLEPLVEIVRAEGVSKQPSLLLPYATGVAQHLELQKQEAEARAQALQTSLRDYVAQSSAPSTVQLPTGPTAPLATPGGPTVTPQLSESFLDRLERMSVIAQEGEMDYRRKLTDQIIRETRQVATIDRELSYYKNLQAGIERIGRQATNSGPLVAVVNGRTAAALQQLATASSQLAELYREISTRNLDPAARLYEITSPVTDTSRWTRPLDRLAIALIVVLLGTLIVAAAGVLAYAAVHPPAETR
jgi:hypothetical protein